MRQLPKTPALESPGNRRGVCLTAVIPVFPVPVPAPASVAAAPTSAPLLLARLLAQVPGLNPADTARIARCWAAPLALKRHAYLVRPGEVEQRLALVTSGLLRIYYATPAGEEICVGFGHPATLLCSFPSFVSGEPSEYAVQALRGSTLLTIGRAEFRGLLDEVPALGRHWRHELEKALVGRMTHEIDLLLPEPAQRLARLRQRAPHLFQLVPRKYLASYLRMAPETLSRLG